MNGSHRIFIPMYGIATILTLVAISSWVTGGSKESDGLLLASAVLLVWGIVVIIRSRKS
jgi:hypothetical protein